MRPHILCCWPSASLACVVVRFGPADRGINAPSLAQASHHTCDWGQLCSIVAYRKVAVGTPRFSGCACVAGEAPHLLACICLPVRWYRVCVVPTCRVMSWSWLSVLGLGSHHYMRHPFWWAGSLHHTMGP